MKNRRDDEFRAFVRDHRAGLLRTAVLLTAGDRHLAEDLTQTTLTTLYVKWPVYRQARNPAAYVRRCMVNALIDEKRRPWRRERATDEVPEGALDNVYLPYDQIAADLRSEALYAALRDLPPRMRAVLVLRYFHDLSVEETAEALTCSTGTVKSQAKRALDKLRERMSDRLAPDTSGAYGA
ncbi:SigE family RNA polymerase sigma factor [Kineosporia sp. J2-2]|uniref:SigE family RNA polymerase sigma factor n=1 Tax=Kineosporia corallincola TaxID=2835133 RepID=A0ABS5TT33_9ACTN|nr:SigE family RNA polymerase sigma factor [Kineosporia corallincola]MBT0773969.1 SigE family RNA polymerase sigma factor [Kineosporia corallincola]